VLSGVFYEPFGPNGGWVWGNSTQASPNTHTRIFDKDFRATRITSDLPEQGAQPYFDRELTWDAASRITSITNHGNTALSGSYGYDALDRLASVTMSSVTSTYVYDEVGNRVSTTLPAGVSTYSYAPGSHRLTAIAGAQNRSFTFDAAGNVTSDGATTRVYGGNGRAKQVSSGSSVTGYGINALGQRVEKLDASGIPTFFVYDEGGHLVGEYGADGKAVQETIWLGDLPVAIVK
jgi:YD repeat-containing protein